MLGDLVRMEDAAVLNALDHAAHLFWCARCDAGENLFAAVGSAYMALYNEWLNAGAPGA